MDADFDKRERIAQAKQQESEIAIQQKEQEQKSRIDGLLRLYQSAGGIETTKDSLLGTSTKTRVVGHLADMVNIIEREDWDKVHPHDAFPDIDIRMLVYECPDAFNCPFLMAILKKINMKNMDYTNYKKRAGMMIAMEHKRKMGKRK